MGHEATDDVCALVAVELQAPRSRHAQELAHLVDAEVGHDEHRERVPPHCRRDLPRRLDVDLPGMSGIDLQRQLIDSGSDVPIIFISGKQVGSTRAHALSEGAVGFFHKPFSRETLLNALRSAGA